MTDTQTNSSSVAAVPASHPKPQRDHWWWHPYRYHPHTHRGWSIFAAIIVDIGLVWFLGIWHSYNPPVGGAELLGYRILAGFAIYVCVQQWTLAGSTATEPDRIATVDKFIALTPFIVVLLFEVFWAAWERSLEALSWRHHMVAILYFAYSYIDYSTTDTINQRLRARQFGVGPQSVG